MLLTALSNSLINFFSLVFFSPFFSDINSTKRGINPKREKMALHQLQLSRTKTYVSLPFLKKKITTVCKNLNDFCKWKCIMVRDLSVKIYFFNMQVKCTFEVKSRYQTIWEFFRRQSTWTGWNMVLVKGRLIRLVPCLYPQGIDRTETPLFCYERRHLVGQTVCATKRVHQRNTQHAAFPVWFLRHKQACTRSKTPSCRADVWTLTSYSIRSDGFTEPVFHWIQGLHWINVQWRKLSIISELWLVRGDVGSACTLERRHAAA